MVRKYFFGKLTPELRKRRDREIISNQRIIDREMSYPKDLRNQKLITDMRKNIKRISKMK